jgi:hypothetical protein
MLVTHGKKHHYPSGTQGRMAGKAEHSAMQKENLKEHIHSSFIFICKEMRNIQSQ